MTKLVEHPRKTRPKDARVVPRAFEPHYGAGADPFANLRPTPAKASSLSGTISSKIAAFGKKSGNGKWTHLPRAGITARLQALVKNPVLVYQDGINACGPALATYLYAREQPERFVDYAIDLYDNGKGMFGSLEIDGTPLVGHDPLSWSAQLGVSPKGEIRPGLPVNEWLLDWMLLAALRRDEDSASNAITTFDGMPDDGVSGITYPHEMEKWLTKGVGFTKVRDETTLVRNKDLDHLEKLKPKPDRSIVLLVNVDVLSHTKKGAKKSRTKTVTMVESEGIPEAVQSWFPNHYCELEQPVAVGKKVLVWTWGQSGYPFPAFQKTGAWEDGYFGALICEK